MQAGREGTAGHRGAEARSDCWVRVWSGVPDQTRAIRSKVESMYGASIRALVESTLAALGAADLSIEIDDQGALPYTLMARIEAAVKRLRPEVRAEALPPALPDPGPPRPALRRSRLYLPGDAPKYFINAGLHQPDAIILDLEDAVAPTEKDAARILVRNALRAVDFGGAERMVRVNALPGGLANMAALLPHGVDVFVLPKVESADELVAAHRLIAEAGGAARLLPTVETARGVLRAAEIAAAPGVVALSIGLEDYTADIGATRTPEGTESLFARSQIVNAARAAGVQPLSSVYADVDDLEGFLAWSRAQMRMGFDGVACIHPRQVRVAHEAFAPTPDEIERARRIVEAFDDAAAKGIGAVAVDGKMVDAPVAARARRALARAAAARDGA